MTDNPKSGRAGTGKSHPRHHCHTREQIVDTSRVKGKLGRKEDAQKEPISKNGADEAESREGVLVEGKHGGECSFSVWGVWTRTAELGRT